MKSKYLATFLTVGAIFLTVASPVFAESAGTGQVVNFLQSVVQLLVTLAGVLAAVFLVVGGIKYITSSGNPLTLEEAKKTILYALVGLVISISAYVIVDIVSGLATKSFGT